LIWTRFSLSVLHCMFSARHQWYEWVAWSDDEDDG